MGITKTEIFNAKQNKLAGLLKALAHPARVAILQRIIKAENCICVDLVEELGLAQATISQHLSELRKIGIIKGCVEGSTVTYCIDEKVWRMVQNEFEAFFVSYKSRNECC